MITVEYATGTNLFTDSIVMQVKGGGEEPSFDVYRCSPAQTYADRYCSYIDASL